MHEGVHRQGEHQAERLVQPAEHGQFRHFREEFRHEDHEQADDDEDEGEGDDVQRRLDLLFQLFVLGVEVFFLRSSTGNPSRFASASSGEIPRVGSWTASPMRVDTSLFLQKVRWTCRIT